MLLSELIKAAQAQLKSEGDQNCFVGVQVEGATVFVPLIYVAQIQSFCYSPGPWGDMHSIEFPDDNSPQGVGFGG